MFDKETGLYNAKARYFDPQLGRFLTQDSYLGSIDNPPSLHRYFYANANPLRFVDPTGHDAIDYFKDAGKSLYGFGKGVAKGTANLVVGAVVGTGKLAITSAKLTLGTPEMKIQAAHELGEMGNALIDGVKDQARLLKQGLSNPSQILDAAAVIGPEAYGEVIGGAAVDTALTATMFTGVGATAKVAQGAEAVVVGESRVAAATAGAEQAATRARVLANIQESQAAVGSSGFGAFAEGSGVKAAEAARASGSSFRGEAFRAIGARGARLEAVGKAAVTRAGETVIESQYLQGAVAKGFDFMSFKGVGEGAQLILNEAKAVSGAVPAHKFTTFGLGASGQRTFEAALRVARDRIESAGLDVLTRETLLGQLETGGARIRLIGGRGTAFARETIAGIEKATGFKVTSVNLTR